MKISENAGFTNKTIVRITKCPQTARF